MMRAASLLVASALLALAAANNNDEPLFSELNQAEWNAIPKPMLKVLCAPDKVQPGDDMFATFEWWSAIGRPLVIHLDLLDADNNNWIAGDQVEVTGASGKVSTYIQVPPGIEHKNVRWHAYMSPQAEQWPNALVTTSFDAQIGQRTTEPCAPLRNFVRPSKGAPEFNYVVVTKYPTGFKAGAGGQDIDVQYNLVNGSEPSYVSASLLRNKDNSVVAVAQAKAEEGEHTTKLHFDVPMSAGTDPVHIMATLKPAGKAFSERLAEDRVWSTAVYYARKNLRA